MNSFGDMFRIFGKFLFYVTVSLLVVLAVSLSLARVLLPNIDEHKTDIEIWVSELIGQQVEIATLDAAWYGFEPQLVLKGVRLLSDDRMQTHGYFQQARLGIDLFSSALEGAIQPGAFTLEGARFVLVRGKDGRISLEGFTSPDDANASKGNRLLDQWFLKQRLVAVKDSEIVWQDLTKGKKTWLFSDVNLRFRNSGSHHWLDGWVTLPDSLGSRLDVAFDMRGDLLSTNAWSGNAYIESKKLNISEINQVFPFDVPEVNDGSVGLRLWSQWRQASLYSLKGDVELNSVKLSAKSAPKMRVIEHLSANFTALKSQADWEITLDKIQVESGGRRWPGIRIDAKYNPFYGLLRSEITSLDLSEVLPIATIFANDKTLSKVISKLKVTGVVSDLHFSANLKKENFDFLARGGFNHLGNRPWGNIPGIKDVDGEFEISRQAAKILLYRQNIRLDYPHFFSQVHQVKNLEATAYASFDASQFSFSAKNIKLTSRDVNAEGSLTFSQSANEKSKLDLAFYFEGGGINSAQYFVPGKIMPEVTVEWLGESLLSGDVSEGSLLYFGALKEYPFNKGEGLFNVNLKIENGRFKFSDDWPVIDEIDGTFDLDSRKLLFSAESGKTMNNILKNVHVELPDYHATNKELMITGDAYGNTQNKLAYLLSSPIAMSLSQELSPMTLFGKSQLSLDLTIPLSFPEKTKYFGELFLNSNRMLAEEWLLDVNSVSGALRFNSDGIWGTGLKAKMRGVDVDGVVETLKKEDDYQVVIRTVGSVSDKKITEFLDFFIDKAHWGGYFQGRTEVEASVIFPVGSGANKPIRFSLKTDLSGISVDLPYPLRKTGTEIKSFLLSVDLTGLHRELEFDYGDTHGIFEIFASPDTQQVLRGGVGFREKAVLPEEIGYRFSGKLKKFAWDQWGPLLIPEDNKKALIESGGGSSGSIYFDVEVDEFSLFGNKFGTTSIQASHTAQLWSMHLSGDDLEGRIVVPVVMSSAPMVVNMTRLHVLPDEKETGVSEIDPREMPEIKLKVDDFRYSDISFGSLEINAVKTSNGLRLDTFRISAEKTLISAEGDWLITDQGQLSQFNIQIDSQNIGDALKGWGYAGAIGGGTGKVSLDVSWPGKPSDFSFNTASGDVTIDLKDASMLDFELGAAKMFGLLLPRRLLLDFRDVFKKGMHFDEIKGKFTIQVGDAFTSGLFLKGPVADIHMAGRIGLAHRDYDQVVTVNRRIIGDSVPVLAALTIAPLVAAQVFIFKKMFENQIDDILSIQYTIEGAWENPTITPVIKNFATGEDLADELFDE